MTTKSFSYTGAAQSWTVPAGVTSITATLKGAGTAVINGGLLVVTLAVTPAEVLKIYTGGSPPGAPTGGWNGGGNGYDDGYGYTLEGGGGATDIRQGGTALSKRIAVAGGAGGSQPDVDRMGGKGGGTIGGDSPNATFGGGKGGTQSAGGSGGTYAEDGALGVGGNGTYGGGGGYYGGGGGASCGGGGGSSYSSGTIITNTQGGAGTGNGSVSLVYSSVQADSASSSKGLTLHANSATSNTQFIADRAASAAITLHANANAAALVYDKLSAASAGLTLTANTAVDDVQATTRTYVWIGEIQYWTVPAYVLSVTVEAKGAAGRGPGLRGDYLKATLPVTPGEVLAIQFDADGGAPNFSAGTPYGGQGGGSANVVGLAGSVWAAGGAGTPAEVYPALPASQPVWDGPGGYSGHQGLDAGPQGGAGGGGGLIGGQGTRGTIGAYGAATSGKSGVTGGAEQVTWTNQGGNLYPNQGSAVLTWVTARGTAGGSATLTLHANALSAVVADNEEAAASAVLHLQAHAAAKLGVNQASSSGLLLYGDGKTSNVGGIVRGSVKYRIPGPARLAWTASAPAGQWRASAQTVWAAHSAAASWHAEPARESWKVGGMA